MYAVGVGKAVEDELREIASDPVDKHFFYSADFSAINQIAENLKLNVCAGKNIQILITFLRLCTLQSSPHPPFKSHLSTPNTYSVYLNA